MRYRFVKRKWNSMLCKLSKKYLMKKKTDKKDHFLKNIFHINIETTGGLGTEEFCDSLFKFLHLVEKAYKQKPLIYTGANFYDNYLLGKLDSYKLMIAQYTKREPVLRDGRDFEMWQYTGKGRLNGVNGYVDKSRFMGKHRLREIRFRHR